MKKSVFILICLVLVLLTFFCINKFSFKDEKTVKIIHDGNFDGDFSVLNVSNSNPVQVGILRFDNEKPGIDTVWKLAQWSSKYNIAAAKLQQSKKQYFYENKGKRITKEIDKNQNTLILSVNGSNEFNKPRKNGQSWPHLLIEQDTFDSLGINKYKSIHFTIDVMISKCENKMNDSFNQELHCAQTTAYFIVSDRNVDSKGYGDYFWFGMPIFDSRYEYPPGAAVKDRGAAGTSGKLIYTPPGKDFLTQNLMDGNWEKISLDILPYIKKAFFEGKESGYLTDSKWEDLKITSFNLGWEVTGTFDVEMKIKNLSCNAVK